MKIYFATHGTTTDNENEIATGWNQGELSELGIKQSKELANELRDIKFDIICTSDLKRAVDTVKLAFGDPSTSSGQAKYPIIIDKRLRELNYGDFNGKSSKEVSVMKMEAIKKPFPNGESYEQAMERTHEFYKELKEKYPDKTVLVVGHRATQFGLDTLTGKTIEDCLSVKFKWQPYWEYNL